MPLGEDNRASLHMVGFAALRLATKVIKFGGQVTGWWEQRPHISVHRISRDYHGFNRSCHRRANRERLGDSSWGRTMLIPWVAPNCSDSVRDSEVLTVLCEQFVWLLGPYTTLYRQYTHMYDQLLSEALQVLKYCFRRPLCGSWSPEVLYLQRGYHKLSSLEGSCIRPRRGFRVQGSNLITE